MHLKTLQKFQLVQSVAAHLLTGGSHLEHVTAVLWEVRWLAEWFYAQFKMLVIPSKAET